MGKIYDLNFYKQQKMIKMLNELAKNTREVGLIMAEKCFYLADKAKRSIENRI